MPACAANAPGCRSERWPFWCALGTVRCRSEVLPRRRGDPQAAFEGLRERDCPETVVELACEGLKRGAEFLTPFVVLLWREARRSARHVESDDLPGDRGRPRVSSGRSARPPKAPGPKAPGPKAPARPPRPPSPRRSMARRSMARRLMARRLLDCPVASSSPATCRARRSPSWHAVERISSPAYAAARKAVNADTSRVLLRPQAP